MAILCNVYVRFLSAKIKFILEFCIFIYNYLLPPHLLCFTFENEVRSLSMFKHNARKLAEHNFIFSNLYKEMSTLTLSYLVQPVLSLFRPSPPHYQLSFSFFGIFIPPNLKVSLAFRKLPNFLSHTGESFDVFQFLLARLKVNSKISIFCTLLHSYSIIFEEDRLENFIIRIDF